MSGKLKITQVKSKIRQLASKRKTLEALGLTKIGKTVVHNDTPEIQGMVRSVAHLVTVEEQK